MPTQRETCERSFGSMPWVAPKKMKAPDSGLTIENSAPKASRNVVKIPFRTLARVRSLSDHAVGRRNP